VKVGGATVWRKNAEADHDSIAGRGYNFFDLLEFAQTVSVEELDFISSGIDMNKKFVEVGRRQPEGLRIGDVLMRQIDGKETLADLGLKIKSAVCAGVDARMGGLSLPVMASAGSGNLGIAATVPLAVVCDHLALGEERLLRATALANLFHIYVKERTGRLTAICGGVLVGMGVSAAIAWLLGGSREQIAGAVKNMAANMTGTICDGANYGCSFKVGAAAAEAYYSAVCALNGSIAASGTGIVSDDVDETIRNVIRLVTRMSALDPIILDMMNGQ
jgi:L-cysteine desulfidase